ncbi:MAG: MerR family transcriptional regulator [Beduini sp.]|uniref:MerR family transcriptional regulator n=1 Tax=Beduini sp. TaxID=1922300 RepID=UPI0039A196F6
MYKISQFSKITGLTVKALRYYDEENLLKPSYRNEENQYRYYCDSDLQKGLLIKYLRFLDFSIMEIKECIEMVESEEDLAYILQEKINIIEKNISKEKELILKMGLGIPLLDKVLKDNPYQVERVEIDSVFAGALRFTGKYSDLAHYVPKLYKAVKNNKNGRHFNCYYDEACTEEADIELCIPIKKQIKDSNIKCKWIPKIKAIRTIHYGSYETMHLAYKALFEYVNAHDLTVLTPSREIYIKSPGMIFHGNPANYITEILLPYEIDGKAL